MDEVVNRLFDMQVEEVSLVDRAANQHRFLVVKQEDGMEGAEVVDVENGCSGEMPEMAPKAAPALTEVEGEKQALAEAKHASEEAKPKASPEPPPFEEILAALRQLTARLGRVEKQFGLPNSSANSETSVQSSKGEVGWPLDLNTPLDRASVDKGISFHDV